MSTALGYSNHQGMFVGSLGIPGLGSDSPPQGRQRLRFQGGLLATFRQSVELTIPALRRYARSLTRDADIADDLVQDTLVRALRSEHLFLGGDVRSWMYTILTNLNRNRLRSLSRRPAMASLEDHDAPDASGSESGGRDIERAPGLLDLCEHRVEGGRVGNVAMTDHQPIDLLGQRLDPLFQGVALISEGQIGTVIAAGPGDAPGDRAVIGDAHDQPAFAAHQT